MGQYPPSGTRRKMDDFDEEEDDGLTEPSDPNRPGGNDRQFTYYPEERYWTDYLRIAAPVLGVIILLGLAWFWLSHLIGGSGGGTPATNPSPTTGSAVIIAGSPSATTIAGTPIVVATAGTTAVSQTPSSAGSGLASGAAVVVANTGGSGVNMRDSATTGGNVVAQLSDGTALTITGDSVDADGYTWWPVKTSDGKTGYVVADYLQPSS